MREVGDRRVRWVLVAGAWRQGVGGGCTRWVAGACGRGWWLVRGVGVGARGREVAGSVHLLFYIA